MEPKWYGRQLSLATEVAGSMTKNCYMNEVTRNNSLSKPQVIDTHKRSISILRQYNDYTTDIAFASANNCTTTQHRITLGLMERKYLTRKLFSRIRQCEEQKPINKIINCGTDLPSIYNIKVERRNLFLNKHTPTAQPAPHYQIDKYIKRQIALHPFKKSNRLIVRVPFIQCS
jgi:hypothetical protein